MLKVAIIGAKGRMGQALLSCAARMSGVIQVAAAVDIGDDLRAGIEAAGVVIDFSHHEATPQVAAWCAEMRRPLVIGTTGHSAAEQLQISQCKSAIPIVWSANFSTGVNTLFWLARRAVEILGPDFDIEIVEMHHRLKKDAPSGTAMKLAEILAAARGLRTADDLRHGREGLVGERPRNEIGIHAVRGGDVVGDHTVIFAAVGERIELTHKASSRETFAQGALRAAQWVVDKKPGIYDMQDVLGLK